MTAQVERPPKKIRIQHRTNAEQSLALARKINKACRGALDVGAFKKNSQNS